MFENIIRKRKKRKRDKYFKTNIKYSKRTNRSRYCLK